MADLSTIAEGEDSLVVAALARRLADQRAIKLLQEVESQDAKPPTMDLMSAQELRDLPELSWLVQDMLPDASLCMVFGPAAVYKSFGVLDLALAITNGEPWMGHQTQGAGPVAMVLGEGRQDVRQRIDAWLEGHPGANDDRIFFSLEQPLDLIRSADVEAIIRDLEEKRLERYPGEQWRLIVFDALADFIADADEDRATDFSKIKRVVQQIQRATGAAMLLVHHTGHDEARPRGSSRMVQSMDAVWRFSGSQQVSCIKQKFGPKFDPFSFDVVPAAGSIYTRKSASGSAAAASRAMAAVSKHAAETVRLGREAIQHLTEHPECNHSHMPVELRIGKKRWPEIRTELVDSGYLDLGADGNRDRAGGMRPTEKGLLWAQEER